MSKPFESNKPCIMLAKLMFHFDLCGFCTEYSQSTARNALNYLIFLVHQVFLLLSVLIKIQQIRVDDSTLSRVMLANEAMRPYTETIACFIIIIDSFASRKSQRRYWIIFKQIQNLQNNKKMDQRTFTFFYMQSIFWTFFSEFLCIYIFSLMQWHQLIFSAIFIIQTHVYQNRIHYFTLHLNIVYAHLEYACGILCAFSSHCNTGKLREFRINYILIAEAITSINLIFGWSNAAAILFSFNMLLSQLNLSIDPVSWSYPLTVTSKLFASKSWLYRNIFPFLE